MPPSATMHTFPEPRGELQMHNGTPYHMGRQCSVEGKPPPAPSDHVSAFHLFCCPLEKHAAVDLCCHALRSNILCNFMCWLSFCSLNVLIFHPEGAEYSEQMVSVSLLSNFLNCRISSIRLGRSSGLGSFNILEREELEECWEYEFSEGSLTYVNGLNFRFAVPATFTIALKPVNRQTTDSLTCRR